VLDRDSHAVSASTIPDRVRSLPQLALEGLEALQRAGDLLALRTCSLAWPWITRRVWHQLVATWPFAP
jgi:hypothetical protein